MSEIRIRPARPDELETLVAIDDDACALDASAGIVFAFGPEHPYAVAERVRWADAIAAGRAEVAVTAEDVPVGFAIVGRVDGQPYLDQLSVASASMRRGVGRGLLHRAVAWAASQRGAAGLWLTTYAHLPWNRPFYEREGFVTVDEAACGPELREVLRLQRAALPCPHHRIAMTRPIARSAATPENPAPV